MIALLDVNLLIALAWPNHVYHEAAHAWFSEHRDDGWATSPFTQAGFVRVSSNRRILPQAKTPAESFALLVSITHLPAHIFFPDDVDLSCADHLSWERVLGYQQVTDAALLVNALSHNASVATFDRGMKYLLAPDAQSHVVEIQARQG